jgi:hypothetical protein
MYDSFASLGFAALLHVCMMTLQNDALSVTILLVVESAQAVTLKTVILTTTNIATCSNGTKIELQYRVDFHHKSALLLHTLFVLVSPAL